MNIGLACLVIFLIFAALMYSRKVSALLALPLMATFIAIAGGIAPADILTKVIGEGSLKLHAAYTTTIFGAVLAEIINRHGIAKGLVRWAAEFAGDSPFLLGFILMLVTALLFSCLGGLGAVIMVGTIVLPVMLSIGIQPLTAGGLYLFGISLGGMFNLANWKLYMDVLAIEQAAIQAYVVPFAGILALVALVFLAAELKGMRNFAYMLVCALVFGGGLYGLVQNQNATTTSAAPAATNPDSIIAAGGVLSVLALYACFRHYRRMTSLPALAYLTPLVSLLLVLSFHWDIIAAFMVGIAYGVLTTWRRDSVNVLTRSIIDGGATVIPAVVLMIGIGQLLAAVMHPAIATALGPLLSAAVPTTAVPYVLCFLVLAPFALYRGPLSLWGMGSGLVKLMQSSTKLSGPAIMGMLMSVGQLQGICDPTNTHNVWIATYLGTDTQALLRKTIPYAWLAVLGGLVLAVVFGYVPWQAGGRQ